MPVADRPHSLTLLLGFITLVASAVGYFIAYEALKTNQDSLKVGQRAYLGISLKITSITEGKKPSDNVGVLEVRINNLGNTPAHILSGQQAYFENAAQFNFKDMPPIISGRQLDKIGQTYIGPKDSNSQGQSFFGGGSVVYRGEITWKDVFEQQHKAGWCYVFENFGKQLSNIWPCWSGNFSE